MQKFKELEAEVTVNQVSAARMADAIIPAAPGPAAVAAAALLSQSGQCPTNTHFRQQTNEQKGVAIA